MAQEPTELNDDFSKDHLFVKHPDGRTEKIPIPESDNVSLRVGRELDNDVVLTDPRSSRHHAEIRRQGSVLEIKDLNSANGVLINDNRIDADKWVKFTPGQQLQMAETRLTWEKSLTSQATVAMKPQPQMTTVSAAVPPPSPAAAPAPAPAALQQPTTSYLPWAIGIGAVIVLLLLAGLGILFTSGGSGEAGEGAEQPAVAGTSEPGAEAPAAGRGEGLALQTPAGGPTDTPTPSGPQLAIPVLEILSTQVTPIIFGASPTTRNAYIFIDVRARNAGNIPFIFSISNFTLQTRDGQTFQEAGHNTSENYLRQLGAIDRFENLALTPGGSVPGSLVFELEIDTYDLELVFDAPDLDPIVLGLGAINMARDLAIAAGTPAAEFDASNETPTAQPTPTLEPTPTPTRPALIPAPQEVTQSSLVGVIAYPVFNGESYDIYLGDVESSETRFFRDQASQPAFSPDGSRIAFRSWDNSSRGVLTMDAAGGNPTIVASFIEDQLPTWTADGSEIILFTRRSGDRKSQLIKVGSTEERSDGVVLGEGEYPTVGPNNQLFFKGWGNTAFGLRQSDTSMENIQTITNVDQDTAPAISPDGQKVAFMSMREDNWDIYVINVDGSGLQRLTTDPARDGLPAWSPDGEAIAFVSDRGGIWAIWVMRPDGQAQSQLFTMEGSADGYVGSSSPTDASRGWAEERISWTR